ncbi:Protein of unknown function [Pyronema omphalodes CBS 100304]|uniref:Uncharacterized protein n=1 Tax=Pyronema omphalodes (strain CBS 100304) TaxID=1076935 RepID=U4KVS0_PYROM|nr:Protein of unknown function [Pyronema omphalodes CBS 100304]
MLWLLVLFRLSVRKPTSHVGENISGALDLRARGAEELSSMVELTLLSSLAMCCPVPVETNRSFRTHCYAGSFSTPVAAQLRGSTADTPPHMPSLLPAYLPPREWGRRVARQLCSYSRRILLAWLERPSYQSCWFHRRHLTSWIELNDQTSERPLIYTGNPIPRA